MAKKQIKVIPKPSPLDRLLKKAVKKTEKMKVTRMSPTKPAKPAPSPQVYKKTEMEWMIDLIQRGLWRSTNLAEIIGINRETVDKWKKLPEVIEERRKVVWKTLGSGGKGRGVEAILKEMGVETDPDKLEITHKFEDMKDDELDNLIASKANQAGLTRVVPGKGAAQEVKST